MVHSVIPPTIGLLDEVVVLAGVVVLVEAVALVVVVDGFVVESCVVVPRVGAADVTAVVVLVELVAAGSVLPAAHADRPTTARAESPMVMPVEKLMQT